MLNANKSFPYYLKLELKHCIPENKYILKWILTHQKLIFKEEEYYSIADLLIYCLMLKLVKVIFFQFQFCD